MFQPGKGVRVPLTMDLVEHIMVVMEELQEVMDNFIANPNLEELIAELKAKDWEYETDKYGHSLWCDFEVSPTSHFRIKLVIDKQMRARIDFREWWEKE